MENILEIDIGGQGIKLRYESEEGRVFKQIYREGPFTIERLQERISHFIKHNKLEVQSIGISQAGIIVNNEVVKSSVQPKLIGMNAKSFERIGIETAFIVNDGKAMAFAANKKYHAKNIVAIAAGTGIGSGIIMDGKVINGVNQEAGEIHHMPVETEEGLFSLGRLCSGTAIVSKFGLEYTKQHLQEEKVQEVIQKAGKYMGYYILMAKRFLDPEVIYITGGAVKFKGYFEAAMDYVTRNIPNIEKSGTMIVKSEDPFFDGCIGAKWYAQLQKQSNH